MYRKLIKTYLKLIKTYLPEGGSSIFYPHYLLHTLHVYPYFIVKITTNFSKFRASRTLLYGLHMTSSATMVKSGGQIFFGTNYLYMSKLPPQNIFWV